MIRLASFLFCAGHFSYHDPTQKSLHNPEPYSNFKEEYFQKLHKKYDNISVNDGSTR